MNVAQSEIRYDGVRLSEVLKMLFHKYTFSRSLETGKKEPWKKMKVFKPFTKNKVYPKLQKKERDLHWGAVGVLSRRGSAGWGDAK